jgi:hypothetical protein
LADALALAVAAVLLAAAALKVADRGGSAAALSTYGLQGRLASVSVVAIAIAETSIAVGLLLGSRAAAYGGGALLAGFALALGAALASGRAGAPCGCLGARGGVSVAGVVRAAALSVACLGAPGASGVAPLVAAAIFALVVGCVLVVERAGLLAPAGALSLDAEGPELGATLPASAEVLLFTAAGCALCARVRRALGVETVTVTEFGEDSELWRTANVPGAPYLVVLEDGVVRAKGTANTGPQVRSLLAGAERAKLERQVGARPDDTPTRRTFLAQAAALGAAAVGARALVAPGEAEAYHFCGHIYTTDSCPHPTGLPRIDRTGYPLRAKDGRPVDDLGRTVDREGRPVDEDGVPATDAEGRPLPIATRTRVCTATARRYGFRGHVDGAWYRCCGGQVRKLVDCCTTGTRRINGDRALKGYCYKHRKVFCVMYYDTKVPC